MIGEVMTERVQVSWVKAASCALALRLSIWRVEPISLNMSDLLIFDSLCARNRLSLNC